MSTNRPGALRRALGWTVGLALIALGVFGWFVPVLQGWVLVVAGLAVLSSYSRWARVAYDRIKRVGRKVRDGCSRRAGR